LSSSSCSSAVQLYAAASPCIVSIRSFCNGFLYRHSAQWPVPLDRLRTSLHAAAARSQPSAAERVPLAAAAIGRLHRKPIRSRTAPVIREEHRPASRQLWSIPARVSASAAAS
jgi:hypothetical protein